MADYVNIDLERIVRADPVPIGDDAKFSLLQAVKNMFLEEHMERSYCDQYLARMTIDIQVELTEKQQERLNTAVCTAIKNSYYKYFEILGFNDQAFALTGSQVKIFIGDD